MDRTITARVGRFMEVLSGERVIRRCTVLATLRSLWLRCRRDRGEEGQGMVEYAFILVLVSIVALLLVILIGHQTNNLYSNITSSLGT